MEKRWYKLENGREVYRFPAKAVAASDFPMPMVRFDTISPIQSQADGKMYDSLSALRKTYRADGNPQGMNYIEIGNESLTKWDKPKRDDAKAIEAIERAEADIAAGRAPEIGTVDPGELTVKSIVE